jgi:hypothetical protein
MNALKSGLLFICLNLLWALPLSAQFNIEDFRLSGTATKVNDQCIRLVPDFQYVSGSAWYEKPIDLSVPFQMEVCLVFGEKDLDGADGIVFVFHPRVAITGWRGEGMGFSGLRPSLGIEFDTYLNFHLADPEEDHIAVMANGQTHHYASLVPPVKVANLEDGERHIMRITWDPAETLLQVFLDNEQKVAFSGDIVNGIFGGNPVVYWGVTSATGRLSNNHEICIKKLLFADASKKVDGQKSLGGVQFQPGTAQFAVDSYAEMDKLLQYLNENPERVVAIEGHTGRSDAPTANQQLSNSRVRAVVEYLQVQGIRPERILSDQQQEPYELSFAGILNVEQSVKAIVFLPKK